MHDVFVLVRLSSYTMECFVHRYYSNPGPYEGYVIRAYVDDFDACPTSRGWDTILSILDHVSFQDIFATSCLNSSVVIPIPLTP